MICFYLFEILVGWYVESHLGLKPGDFAFQIENQICCCRTFLFFCFIVISYLFVCGKFTGLI